MAALAIIFILHYSMFRSDAASFMIWRRITFLCSGGFRYSFGHGIDVLVAFGAFLMVASALIAGPTIITVDGGSAQVGANSLALVDGRPAISYHDFTNRELKFVRALDEHGSSWGVPITLDSDGEVGGYSSLTVIGGRPAVAYFDMPNWRLKFISAQDAAGTTWNAPIFLDTPYQGGLGLSLEDVNGAPAIAFYGATSSLGSTPLKYIRANDAAGASWGESISFPGHTPGAPTSPSLAIIDGRPAIAYGTVGTDSVPELMYVHANDAEGTVWGTPSRIYRAGNNASARIYASLSSIDGKPAISYFDPIAGDLKFVRGTSSGFVKDPQAITLDSVGTVGEFPSLVVINGVPTISYYDASNGKLKLVRARDAGGSTWDAPIVVASAQLQSSLALINGYTGISYMGSFDLMYAYHVGARIVSITPPANAVYKAGETLTFTVTFSEPVVIDTSGGTPRLVLDVGGVQRHAVYKPSASTATALEFSYTAQSSDDDVDGISIFSPLDLNGGTIRAVQSELFERVLSFSPPSLDGVKLDDTQPGVSIHAMSTDDRLNASEAGGGILTISGVATDVEDGRPVTVTLGSQTYATTVSSGEWSVSVGTVALDALANGTYPVKANVSGLTGKPASRLLVVDVVAPVVAISVISGDNRLNAAEAESALTIAGTTTGMEDGRVVMVTLNGGTYTGLVSGGTWSVLIGSGDLDMLTGRTYTVTADASDLAGNPAVQVNGVLIVDKEAPTIALSVISGDDRINAFEVVPGLDISGTANGLEDGRPITVTLNGESYTGTVDNGAWKVWIGKDTLGSLANQIYTVSASASDLAGNPASPDSRTLMVDEVMPMTISVISTDDRLDIADIDASDPLIISGTVSGVEGLFTVRVSINGKTYAGSVVGTTWSVAVSPTNISALVGPSYLVSATVSDLAGNSALPATRTLVVDRTAPSIAISVIGRDDRVDAIETLSDLSISGSASGAEDDVIVSVAFGDQSYTGKVANNRWMVSVPASDLALLSDRLSYTVTADVTDAAGNPAAPSTRTLTVDKAQPAHRDSFKTVLVDGGTADGDNAVGSDNSMAIVNGFPAVAYFDQTARSVVFARNRAADGSGLWDKTMVAPSGDFYQFISLAVVDGNPAIAYFDGSSTSLKFIRASNAAGTEWGALITVAASTSANTSVSLAVVNGFPAIGYVGANEALIFVRATDVSGAAWAAPVTVDKFGAKASLAVIDGRPAMSYTYGINGGLRFVRATDELGSTWGTPIGLGGYALYKTTLAVMNGYPVVGFADSDIRFVRATNVSGTAWAAPVTAYSSGSVRSVAMAIVDGRPAFSFRDGRTDRELWYLRANDALGSSWSAPLLIDGRAIVASYLSMIVVDGRPAISYSEDIGNGAILFVGAADSTGSTWRSISVVDQGAVMGLVGDYPSLAIIDGRPAMTYSEQNQRDSHQRGIRYVRATDARGSSWGTPIRIDADYHIGFHSSLATVDGRPAIAYSKPGKLIFVRATDVTGSAWGAPITVDTDGAYPSLALVDGFPAISYQTTGNPTQIRYVRAKDAAGSSWGTPVTVDSSAVKGSYPSLVDFARRPAISYASTTAGGRLMLAYSFDAMGFGWEISSVADVVVGKARTSLAVVGGNLAISYFDSTSRDLKYVRATDASHGWTTSTTLDAYGDVGSDSSLAVIEGVPVVSYYDAANGDLKLVRSKDDLGAAWDVPVVVDHVGFVGRQPSLLAIEGKPAIGYYDTTQADLKFAYASGPRALSVSAPVAASYKAGNSLVFTVTFSSPVTVDTTQGIPRLGLTIDGAIRYASYSAVGSTETALVFSHTLQPGDLGSSLAVHPAIDLNGGRIATPDRSADAGLSFHAPTITGVTIGPADQRIVLADISERDVLDLPFALNATVSSGLPLSFSVSGPAKIVDDVLTLNGLPGVVTVTALQEGNTFYLPAVASMSFNVSMLSKEPQIFFSGPWVGGKKLDDEFAIAFAADRSSGTLIYLNSKTAEASVAPVVVNADGTFEAVISTATVQQSAMVDGSMRSTAAAGAKLTLRGSFLGRQMTGSIPELGATFSSSLPPFSGKTASIAGLYHSEAVNAASGSATTIISTQGLVMMAVSMGGKTFGADGVAEPDGTFTAYVSGVTWIEGAVDIGSRSVSGEIQRPLQPTIAFAGLAESATKVRRLVNISARVRTGPVEGRALIAGFVISGTEPKRVLLRGVGPTLRDYGVSDVLANPRIALFDGERKQIGENDNWSGSDVLAAAVQLSAFGLPSGSGDAALLTTLAPGPYTMHVLGDATGVVLAEVYDADTDAAGADRRLVNISTRGFVESGEGVLIGGFVVAGNAPKRVLIRGVGPKLVDFGVAEALADPRLSVFSGQTVVAQNDDWESPQALEANQTVSLAADITAANRKVGAFDLNSGGKDAALVVTLAPGAYTAQVSSATGATGVALVEVYELAD